MPKVVPTSDPSSDLSLAPPSGCTINRFSTTNLPPPDGDAGLITISGWNQHVIGVSASGTGATGDTMYPIGCARGGPAMGSRYGCGFAGMMNADGGGMGMATGSVVFPMIPHKIFTNTMPPMPVPGGTIPVAQGGWPYTDMECIGRFVVPAPGEPNPTCSPAAPQNCALLLQMCEQSPIALGTSNITETIAGGTDYVAGTKMLGTKDDPDAGVSEFPEPLYLVSVTQGGANLATMDPLTGGPSLSMADAAIDVTKDLKLSFSCDGSGTVASGCPGITDLAALLVTTSTSPKTAFALALPSGSAECISTVTAGTITIKKAQLAALVGTQTGGSFQLALARLRLLPAMNGNGHTVAYAGGMGVFGFTNQ
jgi:hypothetical protein